MRYPGSSPSASIGGRQAAFFFARRTPLNLPPDVFTSRKRPVFALRFVQRPVFLFLNCVRFFTAPSRRLSPFTPTFAMGFLLGELLGTLACCDLIFRESTVA